MWRREKESSRGEDEAADEVGEGAAGVWERDGDGDGEGEAEKEAKRLVDRQRSRRSGRLDGGGMAGRRRLKKAGGCETLVGVDGGGWIDRY